MVREGWYSSPVGAAYLSTGQRPVTHVPTPNIPMDHTHPHKPPRDISRPITNLPDDFHAPTQIMPIDFKHHYKFPQMTTHPHTNHPGLKKSIIMLPFQGAVWVASYPTGRCPVLRYIGPSARRFMQPHDLWSGKIGYNSPVGAAYLSTGQRPVTHVPTPIIPGHPTPQHQPTRWIIRPNTNHPDEFHVPTPTTPMDHTPQRQPPR